jgi:hypothetical protein
MEIGINELEEKIGNCFNLKREYEEIERKSKEKYAEMKQAQDEVAGILEGLGKDSYKSNHGTFSYKMEQGFKVPQNDEERIKFFNYLKEKDVFDQLITVNAMTLNSFAKAEEERALQVDGIVDFQIPGIIRGEPYKKYSMRKN